GSAPGRCPTRPAGTTSRRRPARRRGWSDPDRDAGSRSTKGRSWGLRAASSCSPLPHLPAAGTPPLLAQAGAGARAALRVQAGGTVGLLVHQDLLDTIQRIEADRWLDPLLVAAGQPAEPVVERMQAQTLHGHSRGAQVHQHPPELLARIAQVD